MPNTTHVAETWKRLSPQQRRAQLMAIAEELFQTKPYAEIGVADVARAAGITHGLIYHYFASKEALFIAVCEDRAKQLLECSLPDPSLPLPERAERAIEGYLDFVEAHRVSYLNLFRGPNAMEGEFLRICDETRKKIMDYFLDSMGVAGLSLPATRLSLRGYLGFAESAVLEWLEKPAVARESLERLIAAAIGSALRAGLSLDLQPLAPEITTMLDRYDEHLASRARPDAQNPR
jgi:AcrR family transcriptional regulator